MDLRVVALSVALLGACAAPYTVRTVGKGKTAIHASLGGPLVGNLGGAIPLPALVVGAQHGLTDAWDVHGSVHVLPAVFKTPGIDLGATRRIIEQRGWRPELTATLRVTMLTNFESFRIYPELEAYASYLFRQRALVYLGISTFFDFFWPRVHWGPVLGVDVRFRQRWALGIAVRWISPEENNAVLAVDWVTPGKQGMILLQLGLHANLGGW